MSDWGETAKKIEEAKTNNGEFEDMAEVNKERGLKIGIFGRECVGKTFFAMSAPDPVYIIDTEMGAPPLLKQFPGKNFKYKQIFEPNVETLERDDVKSFETIKMAIDGLYRNPHKGGTIVIDSSTDLWSMCQAWCKVTIFKLSPEDRLKYQFDWGPISSAYLQLIAKLLAMPMNVILTARETEEYQGPNPTGKMVAHWQKKTAHWVDFTIHNEKVAIKGAPVFRSTIDKSRPFPKLIGKTYDNLTFDKLLEEIKRADGQNRI